jgi:hypothetical protein
MEKIAKTFEIPGLEALSADEQARTNGGVGGWVKPGVPIRMIAYGGGTGTGSPSDVFATCCDGGTFNDGLPL